MHRSSIATNSKFISRKNNLFGLQIWRIDFSYITEQQVETGNVSDQTSNG